MPKFAANLSLLFTELAFLGRFQAAKLAGFSAVEVLFPYDHDPRLIRLELDKNGLDLVLINTPAGDWQKNERGFAAIPGSKDRFIGGLDQAIAYATILKPAHIHIMSGNACGPKAQAQLISNLRHATKQAPDQSFLIEPLNSRDMPGYFLQDFKTARRVIAAVDAPNLGLQFDAYHVARMSGDIMKFWDEHKDTAKHIQIAGAPGRHEPNVGNIDYPEFFERLDQSNYTGYVSAEYHPLGSTHQGLGWLKDAHNAIPQQI